MQFLWIIPSLFFGTYLTVTTGAWHMLVMSSLTAAVFVIGSLVRAGQKIDLTQPIELIDSVFWVGRKRISKWRLLWRAEWNEKFYEYFTQLQTRALIERELDTSTYFSQLNSNQAFLGFSGHEPVITDFESDGPHLLVVGPTGSGKSKLLQLICGSLLCSTNESQAVFGLIDFKGGATFERIRGERIFFSVSDLKVDQFTIALAQLAEEISKRENMLAKFQVASIFELRSLGHDAPTLFIFCDEFASMIRASTAASNTFEELLSKGRSLGLIVIMASQSLAGIPRSMLINVRQKIALSGADPIDLHLLGFPRSSASSNTKPTGGMAACWLGASGVSKSFVFPASFSLEKTYANRQFSV
jgi:DNA helicase HerA-like ATPase